MEIILALVAGVAGWHTFLWMKLRNGRKASDSLLRAMNLAEAELLRSLRDELARSRPESKSRLFDIDERLEEIDAPTVEEDS